MEGRVLKELGAIGFGGRNEEGSGEGESREFSSTTCGMKIDIERSELELFSRNTDNWLPYIRNLCIELHGPDCEAVFSRALVDYSFDLSCVGELTVCSNLQVRW